MNLDDELDSGVDGMIGAAATGGAAPDPDAAREALAAAEAPVVEIRQPSNPSQETGRKRKSKTELITELAERDQQLEAVNARLQTLEARGNDRAVSDLGAVIALAIQVSGQFVAANRGEHWLFAETEAKPIGDAWAVVAAPYAEKLKEVVPWAIALGVTWSSLKPRLEKDKILMAQTQDGKPKDGEA